MKIFICLAAIFLVSACGDAIFKDTLSRDEHGLDLTAEERLLQATEIQFYGSSVILSNNEGGTETPQEKFYLSANEDKKWLRVSKITRDYNNECTLFTFGTYKETPANQETGKNFLNFELTTSTVQIINKVAGCHENRFLLEPKSIQLTFANAESLLILNNGTIPLNLSLSVSSFYPSPSYKSFNDWCGKSERGAVPNFLGPLYLQLQLEYQTCEKFLDSLISKDTLTFSVKDNPLFIDFSPIGLLSGYSKLNTVEIDCAAAICGTDKLTDLKKIKRISLKNMGESKIQLSKFDKRSSLETLEIDGGEIFYLEQLKYLSSLKIFSLKNTNEKTISECIKVKEEVFKLETARSIECTQL